MQGHDAYEGSGHRQFSIVGFDGLYLRIMVWVRVTIWVRVRVTTRVSVTDRVTVSKVGTCFRVWVRVRFGLWM